MNEQNVKGVNGVDREDSVRLLESLFNAIPDIIGIQKPDHTILRYNEAGYKFLGLSPDQAIGKKCYELIGRDRPCSFCASVEALKTKKPALIEKFIPETKSWLEARSYPVLDENGEVKYLIEHIRNITEKKKLESQLFQSQKMESVGRLAGGIAHDFNNMLGVILGYSDFALESLSPSESAYGDIIEIKKAATHSAELTKQLLAFARKQTVSPVLLDLNSSIESMLKMLKRVIGEDIDLAWIPGKDVWKVMMDPSQLNQILVNLCINARDAISGIGKLTIETDVAVFDEEYCYEHYGFIPGEYAKLVVSDDGCGIDKESLESIFEPFYTTKANSKGTGLGLATVYGIVRQNEGFINVYSEPEKGSSFRIYLKKSDDAITVDKKNGEVNNIIGNGEKILLVEDDPVIRQMVEKMLLKLGYSVKSVDKVQDAQEYALNCDRIDLLITDVVMPEMNGKELSDNLSRICTGLKTLFMSGYTANVIAHRGVLDEGVNFIQKPFSIKELGKKIRFVLKNKVPT